MSVQLKSIRQSLRSCLHGRVTVVLVVISLSIVFVLATYAHTWARLPTVGAELVIPQTQTAAAAPPRLLTAGAPTAPGKEQRQVIEPLIIKLRRTGFEPGEIERPQGRFLLAFDNRTEADDIVVQLKRETGNKLHEVRMPRGNVRWRQALDLHPGRYVLSVVDHPEWVCHITITAR